jgi:hypothetical protein
MESETVPMRAVAEYLRVMIQNEGVEHVYQKLIVPRLQANPYWPRVRAQRTRPCPNSLLKDYWDRRSKILLLL